MFEFQLHKINISNFLIHYERSLFLILFQKNRIKSIEFWFVRDIPQIPFLHKEWIPQTQVFGPKYCKGVWTCAWALLVSDILKTFYLRCYCKSFITSVQAHWKWRREKSNSKLIFYFWNLWRPVISHYKWTFNDFSKEDLEIPLFRTSTYRGFYREEVTNSRKCLFLSFSGEKTCM